MSCFETDRGSPVVAHSRTDDEALQLAVVNAVAAVENRQPAALPALAATIDTDALAELADSAAELCVAFDYAGYHVVVTPQRVELY